MIGKKKIEKEARMHADNVAELKGFDASKPQHLAYCEGNADGFIAGAKWTINEFKKSLWHDAQEKPQDDVEVLLEEYLHDNKDNVMYYAIYNHDESLESWNVFANRRRVIRWLYIDDLAKGDKE